MSIESAVVFGRGFILSDDEFHRLENHFVDNPKLQEKWENFYDRYIQPIDSYSCAEYFIGVTDNLGVEAGSYAHYSGEPSFSKSEINDFIFDMLHLRIDNFIGRKPIKTYILHLLY